MAPVQPWAPAVQCMRVAAVHGHFQGLSALDCSVQAKSEVDEKHKRRNESESAAAAAAKAAAKEAEAAENSEPVPFERPVRCFLLLCSSVTVELGVIYKRPSLAARLLSHPTESWL